MDNEISKLEELKNEIIDKITDKIKDEKKKKTIRWGSRAVTIFLVLLTLLSISQTFQAAVILKKIKSGAIQPANAASAASPAADLQSMPDMVGGC